MMRRHGKKFLAMTLSVVMIATGSFTGFASDDVISDEYIIAASENDEPADDAEPEYFFEDEEQEVYYEEDTESTVEDIAGMPGDPETVDDADSGEDDVPETLDEEEVSVETDTAVEDDVEEDPFIDDSAELPVTSEEESESPFLLDFEEGSDDEAVLIGDPEFADSEEMMTVEDEEEPDAGDSEDSASDQADPSEEAAEEESADESSGNEEFVTADDISIAGDDESEGDASLAGSGSSDFTIVDGVLTEYSGSGGDVIIPDGVTSIGEWVFNASHLTSISIPNSVKSIGDFAFYSNQKLINVTIPNSVKSIGVSAFGHCKNLANVTMPNSATSIGGGAFYCCESLTSITIPKGVTSIEENLFSYCESLTSVTIPNGVKRIGNKSFDNCRKIKTLTIPDSVTSIGSSAFNGCINLLRISIPSSVASISDNAFDNCNNVKILCPVNAKYVISYAKRLNIPYVITVTGITLSKTSATIKRGNTLTLTAEVSPSAATNKLLSWNSSNTSVAEVTSAGKITAVAKGTAVITATAKDGSGVKAACKVTVTEPVTGVTLNRTSATVAKGKTLQLTAAVRPANASNKNVTWKSNYPSRVKVDQSGLVTAVSAGKAAITATTKDGSFTAKCVVTVRIPVTGVALNKTAATVVKGKTLQLTAAVKPTNASNKNVTWKSGNTAVAKVSSTGLVTAVAKGTAVITVTTADGKKTATCKITVKIPVTGVTLDKTTVTLKKGKTLQLTAAVKPTNASNKNLTWSSNYPGRAKVDSNGLVTAASPGRAAITVTTKDGSYTAKCIVIVE